MDEELDITALVEKYEQMRALGKKVYLDADEFALLVDYYNSVGDIEEADRLIEDGLKMHPGSPELMIQNAKKLVYSSMYEEADAYLQHISDDGNIDLPLLKVETLLHLERNEEASKLINEVISADIPEDDFYTFITEVGYLYNDVDMFDRAIHFLEESLKIDDANPDALIDLAYAYEMKNDFEKAIEFNNKLLDIDPYSFEGWVNIGKLHSMNEEYDKSVDAFDFALTINEGDISTMKMKALSLYLNDNVEEAIRIFEECLKESPDDESLYDSLYEGYEVMEQYDEMLKIVKRKEKKFGPKGILAKKAHVYVEKQDFAQAIEIFGQIPEEERNTYDYYMLEGEIAFYRGDLQESEAAYMKAALESPDNENVVDRLANVSVAREKYDQAVEYLEQLLELDPDYPTAKSRLALIRFEIGTKEPFDKIMEQFSDDELRELLILIMNDPATDYSTLNREKILIRLNEARENRVLFKNIKY